MIRDCLESLQLDRDFYPESEAAAYYFAAESYVKKRSGASFPMS